jgi:hypothetical protein
MGFVFSQFDIRQKISTIKVVVRFSFFLQAIPADYTQWGLLFIHHSLQPLPIPSTNSALKLPPGQSCLPLTKLHSQHSGRNRLYDLAEFAEERGCLSTDR